MENQKSHKKISLTEITSKSFKQIFNNFGFWFFFQIKSIALIIAAFILYAIILILFLLILKKSVFSYPKTIHNKAEAIIGIFIVISFFFFMSYIFSIIWANYYVAALNIDNKKKQPNLLSLNTSLKFICLSILKTFIILIGLIFFILPGLYFMTRFTFSRLFIIDTSCGILESLKQSWSLTNKISVKCFMLLCLRGLFYFIGQFFIIGFFITDPAIVSIYVNAYKQLKEGK